MVTGRAAHSLAGGSVAGSTGSSDAGDEESVGYIVERFTDEERARLSPYVSNLDRPVFVLRSLPQVTAAALFARYSRSPKSLRRLLLDEFLSTSEDYQGATGAAGRERASDLFGRVLAEYGDDSVAQLAGVHLACEQVSQPLAKAIEWGRLAAYLEQSTRYIPYTDRRHGSYRYRRDPGILSSRHGPAYVAAMDGLFDTYCALLDPLQTHLHAKLPASDNEKARRRAVRALVLDLLRGLLPAGTVSNVGVFATPQALEQMVLRLRAHTLPEARSYAELIDGELQREIPEFLTRLDRPDRGGVWVEYLRERAAALEEASQGGGARGAPLSPAGHTSSGVRLVNWDRDGEERIIAAALFPASGLPFESLLDVASSLSATERERVFAAAVGERRNRRHRPGRSFEHSSYTFEVVSDYGAFRDLQRHRLLTIEWQELTPALGFEVPDAVDEAGLAPAWKQAVAEAEQVFERMREEMPAQASYLVTLGHRIRYVLKVNAR
ncbi:MAG TPA: FAD-dependent thymidylate synthase, partial [Candidatus Sulfotelmatobacter sp.]|nr:FAD-dependent thymidylate synthase [Candidatus Sulfotelmatobacter sp.]